MSFGEMRAGQPLDLMWYPVIISSDGEKKNYSKEGTSFFCALSSTKDAGKEFRQGLEGQTFSAVLVSTNLSKLKGIEDGGRVLFKGAMRNILNVRIDERKRRVFIALA